MAVVGGERVKVVRDLVLEWAGLTGSPYLGKVGTVQTPYMESMRSHLVVLDGIESWGPIPFDPDELTLVDEEKGTMTDD